MRLRRLLSGREENKLLLVANRLKNSSVAWFAVSTLILFVLVYLADYREIVSILSSSSGYYVLLSVISGFFTLAMWSVVWYRFFDILRIEVAMGKSLRLLLSGLFLNAVTPLGRFGGEPFVAYLVSNETEATYQQALSSVSSADLSNAVPFATFGLATVAYVAIFGTLEMPFAGLPALAVLTFLLTAVLIYLAWFNGARTVVKLVRKFYIFEIEHSRLKPYIESGKERGREVLDRLETVGKQPKKVSWTLSVSHLAVLGHIGATYFALLAVGVEPVLHTVVLVVSLSAILTFSPTPGSTGTMEAGFAVLVLAFYPVSAATATSVAIIYRVATYLPGVIFGYLSLLSLKRQ